MKHFWLKHKWLRRTTYSILVLLAFCLVVLLAFAYAYMPPEDRGHPSAYLAQLQREHLDHYIDAGNFRLHYLEQGSGEPVVLLPGGGAWLYEFRNIVTTLAPHYAVYVIDPPGDGYTTPLAKNPDYNSIYTLDSIDKSLQEFMDKLHISKAVFGGNSWGGGMALYFAEKHPERVSKYIGLDNAGLALPDPWFYELAKWPAIGEATMKLSMPTSAAATKDLLEGLLYDKSKLSTEMVQELYPPLTFQCNLISQWVLERNLDWKVTDQLIPRMTMPTLVIWGKQDTIEDANNYIPRWHRLNPRAKIVVLDHAGHLVYDDQPEEVQQLMLNFLAS
ncbi:alpha/beta hydrolase [Ktedonosporobacter rubrisoli]|uniref:Alpha/beta hydrolase n=1 Tax=Ktedonosporobacter rubrisoli TaxID=2509675 RepID=A0A4P6JK48_KTERU|nr:alpha/beta hydrolase [Ktedonosporobacter rubrisoli]QBD75547.1 alpha/beta hydrolase [Ktedonosporobacter rubrisoli]